MLFEIIFSCSFTIDHLWSRFAYLHKHASLEYRLHMKLAGVFINRIYGIHQNKKGYSSVDSIR